MTKLETGIVAKKVYVVGGETFDDYSATRTRAAQLRQNSIRDHFINVLIASSYTDEAGAIDIARCVFEHFDIKLKKG